AGPSGLAQQTRFYRRAVFSPRPPRAGVAQLKQLTYWIRMDSPASRSGPGSSAGSSVSPRERGGGSGPARADEPQGAVGVGRGRLLLATPALGRAGALRAAPRGLAVHLEPVVREHRLELVEVLLDRHPHRLEAVLDREVALPEGERVHPEEVALALARL